MPDIQVGNQLFDLAFHPSSDLVCVGTIAGEIKCYSYDNEGNGVERFSERITKRSVRGLDFALDGQTLLCVGKDKILHLLDPGTGKVKEARNDAHDVRSPINRICILNEQSFATGDDEGVIKLWDYRTPQATRTYTHHSDFISDFSYSEKSKKLIATSGDASLSVIDIRSNKTEPLAQSEDQEDELLSIVPIKGMKRYVVGTQLGVLTIFDPAKGWADCVDRIPGHPASVDALIKLPGSDNVILTGSSDGMIRALQVFPNKLLGVIGDHGEFPIERLKTCREGRWLGSASHDEVLKLIDVKDCLEDSDKDSDDGEEGEQTTVGGSADGESDEDEDEVMQEPSEDEDEVMDGRKRKKKRERDPLGIKKKKAKDEGCDPSFFADML